MRSFTITTTSASTFELTYWLECWTAACPGHCAWRWPWCRLRRSRGSSSCASSACPANMLTLLLILLPGSREDSCWRSIDGFLITGLVAVWPSVAQCWAWLPHLLMCCCSYVLVPCCHAHLPQDILSIFRKCSHGGVVAAFGLSTRKIAMIDGTVAKKNNTHNQVFYVMSGRF